MIKNPPKHIGIIPDGNRRWAVAQGVSVQVAYQRGVEVAFGFLDECIALGVSELTLVGFTTANTTRPFEHLEALLDACTEAVNRLGSRSINIQSFGKFDMNFPEKYRRFLKRQKFGNGGMKVNVLLNYDFDDDVSICLNAENIRQEIKTASISNIDLILRWGGRRRLSGFLPYQSQSADLFFFDHYWPDALHQDLHQAISWYINQEPSIEESKKIFTQDSPV